MTVFGGKLYSDTAAATTVLDIDFTDASAYNATQTELTAVTGQCVWENDTVLMSDGRVVRAADLVGTEFEMLGWNEKTGKATPRKAWADWNRKEPVYRLTTDSGREIVRNAHHPIWSANVRTRTSFRQDGKKYSGNAVDPLGWIGLADLRPGQAVLVPTEVKTKADKRIPFEDAALMGYIMGDGTSSGRSAVRFCQEDGEALDEFIQCVRSLGCDVRYDPDSGNARSVVVRGPHADGRSFEVADLDALTDHQRIVAEAVADGWSAPELADATGTTIQNIHQTINRCERNGGLAASPKRGEHAVQALTRKWGLQGVKHVDMEWPEEVWTLHPDDLAVVIGRFWACDGWASVGNSGQPEIAISQHNERVIRDLQRLLLRLGIASTLRTTETTHRDRWTLSVRTESMERFADVIHVTGKQDRVLACVAALASRTQPERWRSLDAPDGYRWERVRSVDMLPGEHWTVAIEVEHDHAWADLVVEHNTVTINRSSTGYKTTIVNENKIVFDGVNDYVEIDDHDRLDFGATESFTATAVWRTWATSAQVVLAKKAGGLASNVGWETFHNAVGGGVFIRIADGTNTSNDSDGSVVAGARVVHSGKRDVAGDYLKAYLSAVSSGQTTDATTGSMANSVALRIGSYSVGATFLGAEFIDFILHRRALSAGEITQLNRELA